MSGPAAVPASGGEHPPEREAAAGRWRGLRRCMPPGQGVAVRGAVPRTGRAVPGVLHHGGHADAGRAGHADPGRAAGRPARGGRVRAGARGRASRVPVAAAGAPRPDHAGPGAGCGRAGRRGSRRLARRGGRGRLIRGASLLALRTGETGCGQRAVRTEADPAAGTGSGCITGLPAGPPSRPGTPVPAPSRTSRKAVLTVLDRAHGRAHPPLRRRRAPVRALARQESHGTGPARR
jgi:hypothetical protein